MGSELAKRSSATFGLPRSFPVRAFSRQKSARCYSQSVLPANSTIGYDELAYLTVTKVNGKEIKSLDDLAEAVKHPIEGFIKVETEEDPKQIELDAAQVAAEAQDLQENYGISALHRLN